MILIAAWELLRHMIEAERIVVIAPIGGKMIHVVDRRQWRLNATPSSRHLKNDGPSMFMMRQKPPLDRGQGQGAVRSFDRRMTYNRREKRNGGIAPTSRVQPPAGSVSEAQPTKRQGVATGGLPFV
jgi:hypothetical protein